MGWQWYEDGKFFYKCNIFMDFVVCVEYLVEVGIILLDWMVVEGGSVGGLLMGVVVNFVFEFFVGILVGVLFVDVLMMIFDFLFLLIVIEWDEWGDLFYDVDVYVYMKLYMLYENVWDGVVYLCILVVMLFNDMCVLYVELVKWVV